MPGRPLQGLPFIPAGGSAGWHRGFSADRSLLTTTGSITCRSSAAGLFTRSETGYATIPSAGYGTRIRCSSSTGRTARDSPCISSSCRRITVIRLWTGAIREFAAVVMIERVVPAGLLQIS